MIGRARTDYFDDYIPQIERQIAARERRDQAAHEAENSRIERDRRDDTADPIQDRAHDDNAGNDKDFAAFMKKMRRNQSKRPDDDVQRKR